jgi:hypothetical protein
MFTAFGVGDLKQFVKALKYTNLPPIEKSKK